MIEVPSKLRSLRVSIADRYQFTIGEIDEDSGVVPAPNPTAYYGDAYILSHTGQFQDYLNMQLHINLTRFTLQRVQEIPPHEDELLGKLRMLGLTDYESRAYLTLIKGEELTAEEISRLSGIPLPRIYSVLDKLVRDSFAKSYNTRPMKFEALPPSIAFARLEKNKEQELTLQLNELRSTAANLRTTLETTYGSAKLRIRPEQLLEPLSDLNSMEERTRSILDSASEEILILTAEFRWFPKIYENLLK